MVKKGTLPPKPKKPKVTRDDEGGDDEEEALPPEDVLPSGKRRDAHWRQRGRKGKRDLLRAARHRAANSSKEYRSMWENPHAEQPLMEKRPSDDFIWHAEKFMLDRYCNFLLQSIMLMVRVFEPSFDLATKYGKGLMTSARCALLLIHTTSMHNAAAVRLMSLDRFLYARMLDDADNREQIDKEVQKEWEKDRLTSLGYRVERFIACEVLPRITHGTFPKTNFVYDPEQQWNDVWQDRCSKKVHLFIV